MLASNAERAQAMKGGTQGEQAKRLIAAFAKKMNSLGKSLVGVGRELVERGQNQRLLLLRDGVPNRLWPLPGRMIRGQRAPLTIDHMGRELALVQMNEGGDSAIHQNAKLTRESAQQLLMITVHLQFSCKAQNLLNLLCTGGHAVQLMKVRVARSLHIRPDDLL